MGIDNFVNLANAAKHGVMTELNLKYYLQNDL